jgi:hypothetical protein
MSFGKNYSSWKKTVSKPAFADSLVLKGKDVRPDYGYDIEQLQRGMKVELEHTNDYEVAKKIVKDHLDENSAYYSEKVEAQDGAVGRTWKWSDHKYDTRDGTPKNWGYDYGYGMNNSPPGASEETKKDEDSKKKREFRKKEE